MNDKNGSHRHWTHDLVSVASIGLLMLICILMGLGFGYWLDSKLNTSPLLAFIFTLFGLAAGIYESAKILIKSIPKDDDS